jgi:hypothetical protein
MRNSLTVPAPEQQAPPPADVRREASWKLVCQALALALLVLALRIAAIWWYGRAVSRLFISDR